MRIFIAIEVPEKIKEKLREVQKEFEEYAVINFVNEFHLTLRFLGELSELKLERVKERLKNLSFKNFDLNLSNLGVFPNKKFINVLWVGLKPEKKVKDIKQIIDEKLRDMFGVEDKFKAHITLGRVKSIKDREGFLKKVEEIEVEGDFKVKDIKLIKSELTKDGAEYETLEVYE